MDEHVVEIEIKPQSKSDWKKLQRAVIEFGKKDMSLAISIKRFRKKILLKGTSEGHLETALQCIQIEHKIDLTLSPMEIIYQLSNEGGIVQVLEPIMKIEVRTPVRFLEVVKQDLHNRGAKIENQDRQNDMSMIGATSALICLLGWESELRRTSHGLANATVKLDRYEPVEFPEGDPPFAMAAAMRARK